MRLLVTGATGLLGLNLCTLALNQGHEVTGLAHSRKLQNNAFDLIQIDLIEHEHALRMIEAAKPEAIIHCAAVANINRAEKAPEMTQKLNVEVPGLLAQATRRWQIPFIHISSDAVFDGKTGGYVESDAPNPLSLYARTKLAAEKGVSDANPNAIIARTVFFGWSLSGQRSLSEFFFNNLKSGNPIQGFSDTFFSPLYVEDLGEILLEMLSEKLTGIFHVTSPQSMSKYEFGLRMASRFGFDPDLIKPIQVRAVDRGASRSLNLTLKPDKIQAALGHSLPTVDEGIDRLYQRYQEDYPAYLQGLAAE